MIDEESIFCTYQNMMHSLLNKYHIMRDRDEFEQLCYIALWEAYQLYDETKGRFSTFAYAKMNGAILMQLRKQGTYLKRHRQMPPYFQETTPAHTLSFDEIEWQLFLQAIPLSSTEKTIISLRLKGYTIPQISNKLQLTINQVKKKLYKTQQMLKHVYKT